MQCNNHRVHAQDKDSSGSLTSKELKEGFQELGVGHLSDETWDIVIHTIDDNNSGRHKIWCMHLYAQQDQHRPTVYISHSLYLLARVLASRESGEGCRQPV